MSAPAGAVVLTSAISIVSPSDGPTTYSISFGDTFPLITGPVSVRLSFGLALADGGRDGAALELGLNPGGLVSAAAGKDFNTTTVVLESGTPQSFTGAGGTAGSVMLQPIVVRNFTTSTVTYDFLAPSGETVSGADRTLHVATAAIFGDGDVADGGAVGLGSTANLVTASLAPAGSAGTGTATGFSADIDGFVSAGATAGLDCSSCSFATRTNFTLTPDDTFAIVSRSEAGREAPPGDVTWTYRPAATSTVFDCGVDGCGFMSSVVSFSLSGRDAVAAVVRLEILPIGDVPVGAPAALPLLAAAVGGLGALRRRRTRG